MKKEILLSIGISMTMTLFAQTNIPEDSKEKTAFFESYWKNYKNNYELYDSWWDVDDQTTNVKVLSNLTPDDLEIGNVYPEGTYDITTEDGVIHANYNKTGSYEKFGMSWMQWEYPEDCAADNWQLVNPLTGEDWAAGCHRTAKGYSVDFSDPANRIVSFKYQVKSDVSSVNLRVDLWDIKGRKTTKTGYICTDDLEKVNMYSPTNDKMWKEFVIIYSDENNEAAYSKLEEEFDNGFFYGTTAGPLADGNNTWCNGITLTEPGFPLLIDSTRIIGLEFYINCEATTKQEVDLYIKDIKIGNTISTAIEKISDNGAVEIVDGIVYSEGKIVILDVIGQKVKSGKEQLDINDLPVGIYFIQTAEGSAKIIK
ncbi:MAG: T9SS type A sorting domain-containing protein [Bacteroidales bacterium]|nr:T9SS type A sorting domain-containing protein [Bacteroidales bacterium]